MSLPTDAKPFERAILIVYGLGNYEPEKIAEILNYPTKDSVYRVLRKYRDFLPECRIAHAQQLVRLS